MHKTPKKRKKQHKTQKTSQKIDNNKNILVWIEPDFSRDFPSGETSRDFPRSETSREKVAETSQKLPEN
jgi:hypothetical protein